MVPKGDRPINKLLEDIIKFCVLRMMQVVDITDNLWSGFFELNIGRQPLVVSPGFEITIIAPRNLSLMDGGFLIRADS